MPDSHVDISGNIRPDCRPDWRRDWHGGLPDLLGAVRQRRRALAATIILVPLCTWIALRQATPLYTATGALVYQASEYQPRELQSMMRSDPVTEAVMATQAEVLQSLKIAEQVAQRGHLFEDPAFNPALSRAGFLASVFIGLRAFLGMEDEDPLPEPIYGPVIDPSYNATLRAVRAALHATPVQISHTVELSFTAPDPMVAAAAVNNAMDAYIKGLYFEKHQKVEQGTAHLQAQARELRRQVERDEEWISDYRARHGLTQGIHGAMPAEQITRLTEDLIRAKGEESAAASRLDAARGRSGAPAEAEVASSVVQLRARQTRLAEEIERQRTRLGPEHPDAVGLARQYAEAEKAVAEERKRVVASFEGEYRTASDRVAALEQSLAEAQRAADQSAHDEVPLNDMQRDLDAKRQQLNAVLQDIQKTAHQAAIEFPGAHEISQALPPEFPSYPRKGSIMAAAVAAGVFLGLLLVHILHLVDDTLRSGDAIRSLTGLPCFALIPEIPRRALRHLRIHEYVARRPLTAFAEQVRSLRASLGLDTDRPQVITITSGRPAEGKSVLTLSLGRSAQSGNERVIALECDVRQSSFQWRLGGQTQTGLLEILRGDVEWRETVQEDKLTGMAYIGAGKVGRGGGDVLALFMSDEMRRLLAELRDNYDLILLDAPPVEAMTEARVASALADATLLCVRWRRTQAKTLQHTLEQLRDAHAKVIGTVLTRVDTREHLRSGNPDAGVYHRRYRAYFRG